MRVKLIADVSLILLLLFSYFLSSIIFSNLLLISYGLTNLVFLFLAFSINYCFVTNFYVYLSKKNSLKIIPASSLIWPLVAAYIKLCYTFSSSSIICCSSPITLN